MIRSVNHSGYPRIGDMPYEQDIRRVERLRAAGRDDPRSRRDVEDTTASICVAEQARAFVDVVTDGLVRWDGLVARWAAHLDGVDTGAPFRWFDTPQFDRRPVTSDPPAWPGPMLVHDYRIAADVAAGRPVKMIVPGPVLCSRLASDRSGMDPDRRTDRFAAAVAHEVEALAEAGCRFFQVAECLLTRRPEDAGRAVRSIGAVVEAAGDGASVVLDLGPGDPRAVLDDLDGFPGTHLGLDVRRVGLEVVRDLPDRIGVQLGLFDAGSPAVEDAADVQQRLEPFRDALVTRDVLVGPHASLEALPRDLAFDKLLQARYLAETLRREAAWAS